MAISGPTTDHHEIRSWAQQHRAVPAEILPQVLDHVPAVLRLILPQMAADLQAVRVLSWEEFFTKFDLLGLTFVYESGSGGYNELLQVDSKDPYRSALNQPIDPRN